MLTAQDKQWLSQNYFGLTVEQDKISGTVEFVATYNNESGQFLILGRGISDSVGGLRLVGKFNIRIEERADKSLSKLPALYLQEVSPIPDRHFGQRDFSACLCSPLEEGDFLVPEFQFKKYFEQLVIPFLYGQVFYTAESHWPWAEYQHGGVGLLQSYFKFDGVITKVLVEEFLSYLKTDRNWLSIKNILFLTRPSKQGCACGSGSKFKNCHPEALKGLIRLKSDISNFAVSLG